MRAESSRIANLLTISLANVLSGTTGLPINMLWVLSLTISESRQIKVLKLLARMGIKLGKENERETTLAIKIACKMNAEYNEELYF